MKLTEEYRRFDGFAMEFTVTTMDWFVKKVNPAATQLAVKLKQERDKISKRTSRRRSNIGDHLRHRGDTHPQFSWTFTFAPIQIMKVLQCIPMVCLPHIVMTLLTLALGKAVNKLLTLRADLSAISLQQLPTEQGLDDKMYYIIFFEVEVTFFSAYTKYELIYEGTNYGAITAEYV